MKQEIASIGRERSDLDSLSALNIFPHKKQPTIPRENNFKNLLL